MTGRTRRQFLAATGVTLAAALATNPARAQLAGQAATTGPLSNPEWPQDPLRADHSQNWEWPQDILFPDVVNIRPILTSCRKASPPPSICLGRKQHMEKASWRRMHDDNLNPRPLRHNRPMGVARRTLRNMSANLASHFGSWTAMPVASYQTGQLKQYTAAIYVGSTYDEPLPTAFLDDVYATTTPVIWAYDNIWQLTARYPNFSSVYGWNWSGFDFSSVAEVDYRCRHRPGQHRT